MNSSLPHDLFAVPTGPPPPPAGWSPGQPVPPSPGWPPGENSAPAQPQRWGIPDIALGLLFIIAVVVAATILGLVIGGLDTLEALVDGDLSGTDAVVFLALTTLGQGGAMGAWPVIVARWKGGGVAADFGWRFTWIDLGYGLAVGSLLLFLAAGVGYVVSLIVGLDPGAEESTNTQIISDAADGPAFVIIAFAAIVMAPIAEELFFRGLCLRAIEKRFGTITGLVASTFLFTLPHFSNPSLAGTTVLFSVIATVGLVLGVLTVKTGRLGAAVIAHAVFNAVGVAVTVSGTTGNSLGSWAFVDLLTGALNSQLW